MPLGNMAALRLTMAPKSRTWNGLIQSVSSESNDRRSVTNFENRVSVQGVCGRGIDWPAGNQLNIFNCERSIANFSTGSVTSIG